MRFSVSAAIGALALAACAGGGHHGPGPAGLAYLCGGEPARIVYEGGGYYPRGSAELHFQGRIVHFAAMPPTYDLRYQEPSDERPVLVWSARGDEAWLSEIGADFSEREIAHCARVRASGGADAPVEASGEHH